MKLQAITHHGSFHEVVTIDRHNDWTARPSLPDVAALLAATAYHSVHDPAKRGEHADRILADLLDHGYSDWGWTWIQLNDTPLPV